MDQWIKITEKRPENEQNIIVRVFDEISNSYLIRLAVYMDHELYSGWSIKDTSDCDFKQYPTHWIPLPKFLEDS